jgi:hypothetical protein
MMAAPAGDVPKTNIDLDLAHHNAENVASDSHYRPATSRHYNTESKIRIIFVELLSTESKMKL